MFGLKKGKERRGEERNGREGRKKGMRRIMKLNFII